MPAEPISLAGVNFFQGDLSLGTIDSYTVQSGELVYLARSETKTTGTTYNGNDTLVRLWVVTPSGWNRVEKDILDTDDGYSVQGTFNHGLYVYPGETISVELIADDVDGQNNPEMFVDTFARRIL